MGRESANSGGDEYQNRWAQVPLLRAQISLAGVLILGIAGLQLNRITESTIDMVAGSMNNIEKTANSPKRGSRFISSSVITIGFLGDVMLGRGIDQILPNSTDGVIHQYNDVKAQHYVDLAVARNGPLPPTNHLPGAADYGSYEYIWGDLLTSLRHSADVLVANLETTLTTNGEPGKPGGINYKSHPGNVQVLLSAEVDVVTLANNHVLDWRKAGLEETLQTLEAAGIPYAGAGRNWSHAARPVIVRVPLTASAAVGQQRQSEHQNGLVIRIVAVGSQSSGINWRFAATESGYGVHWINRFSEKLNKKDLKIARRIAQSFEGVPSAQNELRIVCFHNGPNFIQGTPSAWRKFAHALIDNGVDMVVCHSSHHVKGIEVYRGKMIAYGLGDFLNDYEGIGASNSTSVKGGLYLPRVNITSGRLVELSIIPSRIKNLRVQRAADPEDIEWIRSAISSEGEELGTSCEAYVDSEGNKNLRLVWG